MLACFLALIVLCAPFAAPAQYPSQTMRVAVGGPPEALAVFLKSGQDKWGRAIRDLGIKLQ